MKLAYRHQRPVMGLPYNPPALSREEIQQLIAGTFTGSHPATPSIIDDIQSLQAAMAGIEARARMEAAPNRRQRRLLRARMSSLEIMFSPSKHERMPALPLN